MDQQTPTHLATDGGRHTYRARSRLVNRLIIAAAIFLSFGGGALVRQVAIEGSSSASSSLQDNPDFATVQQVWDLVHDRFVDPDLIDDRELLYGAARGMVDSLGDTGHSTFLDPIEAEAFQASLAGELVGLGLNIEFVNREPVVVAPIHGSPAKEAGIQTDDVIVAVNGVSTLGMSDGELSRRLRGEPGTSVTLTVQRPSDGSIRDFVIERARIELDPVSWAKLPDDLALIQIHEFSAGAGDQLKEALEQITADKCLGIVLDLRNNPGGLVSEAVSVSSQFMREGAPIYIHDERGKDAQTVETVGVEGRAYDLPLVVLINRGSASAAEIVASALADNGRAELVGERSYGTGTVVTTFDLNDGSAVAIGTAFWKRQNGDLVWKVGIQPDIEADLVDHSGPIDFDDGTYLAAADLQQSGDQQLGAAIDQLEQELSLAA
jgi:carboxyl-terminal processing protease